MPANYIYESFFYKPDQKYIITTSCQIFPSDVKFYDYDKIGTNEDPLDHEFTENELKLSNCLSFKVYAFEDNRY